MKVAVWANDLSDTYLKQVTQIGAEYVDFGRDTDFPGVREQGYPDLDGVIKIRKKVQSYGLEINRVTLPNISEDFMLGKGNEKDLENTCNAMKVFAEAGCTLARQRFEGDTFNDQLLRFRGVHRGGYLSRSESLGLQHAGPGSYDKETLDRWWEGFCRIFDGLVPIADETGIRLCVHPSDTPLPDTPFGGIGFHRIIDAYPSRNVGYLYCCGTRAEAGGSSLVLDEINNYGRKGKIFMVHFRNVRGSMATAGGFEETLLDDGDMNMFHLLQELRKVGFDGCVNPDHHPRLEQDDDGFAALAYAVGYIKAMFAALSVV